MTGELTFAFVAGTVATANPCGFALLPAFVARQLGDRAAGQSRAQAVARALWIGALTTAAFLLVFGTIGTAISLGARWLTQAIPWVALAIGAALMVAGLALLLGRRIRLRLRVRLRPSTQTGYRSVLLFGLAYGLTSLSCTLPIFLLVVGTAVTGTALGSGLMFVAYALGMGTILTALAVAAAVSRAGMARAIRRLLPYVDRVSGGLLLAAGAYVVYYWAFALSGGRSGTTLSKPIDFAGQASSSLQGWLNEPGGRRASAVLGAALLALIVWAVGKRALRRSANRIPPPGEAPPHRGDPIDERTADGSGERGRRTSRRLEKGPVATTAAALHAAVTTSRDEE